ncbi:flavin reductase (DIM6/NTAB) family NADH-FMN oxidoreductase RutF [Hymenobacter luteus]|uniref:Flavin reductase (DIM6/NTAB) family NADH-FMN oxidoreductase RutF n=2 Tax=Hymenobacter TaxID=89966 RepID=A0A7W9T166_9BACT|nr:MULTISPECIES: flavin reductase [Hymenobacter]MBB4601981.1 flavin reductase (DIM6/NTAB) family NADH-FMN oxidoreductase RutF [Hymenobacter latericoloratus]MBB6059590.1 flavin reductase (DIM6/NTAB) family NADH-FMN oxidoreductase RutF [Hymenobacter luteus]
MPHFTASDLAELEKVFRLNLINAITGFKSANLLGTANAAGQPNLAIISSVVHLGSNPALLGLVMRPPSVPRHSYDNIRATRYYTLNHVHAGIVREAHYTSANFEAEVSEFAACGLTPEFRDDFPTPYVQESRLQIGLELVQEVPIEANGTVLLIGRVLHLYLPEAALRPDGSLDLPAAGTVALSGLDTYYTATPVARYGYARPGQPVPELPLSLKTDPL